MVFVTSCSFHAPITITMGRVLVAITNLTSLASNAGRVSSDHSCPAFLWFLGLLKFVLIYVYIYIWGGYRESSGSCCE